MNIIKAVFIFGGQRGWGEAKTTTIRFSPLLSIKTSPTFMILTNYEKFIFIVPKQRKEKHKTFFFRFLLFKGVSSHSLSTAKRRENLFIL